MKCYKKRCFFYHRYAKKRSRRALPFGCPGGGMSAVLNCLGDLMYDHSTIVCLSKKYYLIFPPPFIHSVTLCPMRCLKATLKVV